MLNPLSPQLWLIKVLSLPNWKARGQLTDITHLSSFWDHGSALGDHLVQLPIASFKIRGHWDPEGARPPSELTAEVEPGLRAPASNTALSPGTTQQASGVEAAFVLPLLCQLGCANTMNRGCDMQQIKLLIVCVGGHCKELFSWTWH